MSESRLAPSGGEQLFEAFLDRYDDQDWREIIHELESSTHEVDRTATGIWFYFYPLALSTGLQRADDPKDLARKLLLYGSYLLENQIDSSHEFLYGHRYWPQVKAAVSELAASPSGPVSLDLANLIRRVASEVAVKAGIDKSLLTGITAVALATLQQVGAEAFKASSGTTGKPTNKSPEQILLQRGRDDGQGLLGFRQSREGGHGLSASKHLTALIQRLPIGILLFEGVGLPIRF